MSHAPKIKLVDAEMFERPVKLRLPFRFGAATLREAKQAFVRIVLEDDGARRSTGMAAELMVPKWFDKSPNLSNADNEDQLRRSLMLAVDAMKLAGMNTAFGLHVDIEADHHARMAEQGLNGLVASFGLALINRAVLDALCRLSGRTITAAINVNLPGLHGATAPDLDGFDFNSFLSGLRPSRTIAARHTVGLVDAIMTEEIDAGAALGDGLPESLEQAIETYGLTFFKVKVSGDIAADLDRLHRIAHLLDRKVKTYSVTLDGNEQFASADAVGELFRQVEGDARLAKFARSILFIEQPIARAHAFEKPVEKLRAFRPIEIDESDANMEAFPTARELGYTGISSKSCKGFYRSLLNRARVEKWHAEDGKDYFMSAEDLTTQAGLAVQQDLALAALIGMGHVERNGHHYVDGMAGAPRDEQSRFVNAHGDLYAMSHDAARLKINNGRIELGSVLDAIGLGSAVEPDWTVMQTMSQGRG
ncbi:mandelate racemase [Oryzifoliimicrobium ureilyticus]|uniref:mandelate racemase n=1 Tax=Oryzifoliimicrobium ureilyticus TaxID=3113724 RepID=UPI0030767CAB